MLRAGVLLVVFPMLSIACAGQERREAGGSAEMGGSPNSGGNQARAGNGGTVNAAGTAGIETNGGTVHSAGTAGTGPSGGTASAGAATVETYPKPCADIYAPDTLPTFSLEFAADQLALLESDCKKKAKEYRPATLKYAAESLPVMVRLKGNWSYRCEKKQFVISFNQTNPEGRFHGVRKIVLDAPWYDPSLLAERLGFSFMRRSKNPWSCVNHARLTLNGEYYGVYANVERMDKEYLQRHFAKAEAEGDLFEGSELRTNEATGEVQRRDALLTATSIQSIDELADLEQIVRVWAASAMLPDPDSYWAGVEINYAAYDHPSRGFLWFPLDMDLTMRQGIMDPNTSTVKVGVVQDFVQADPIRYQNPTWKREQFYQRVLSEPVWCGRFVEALKNARDAYDVAGMTRDLETWAAQIAEAVATDSHKPFSQQSHLDGVATLKAFMPQRLSFVNEWLKSSHCPVMSWPSR